MRVIVIGAGIAGIQAASILTRIGCAVVVYDKHTESRSHKITMPTHQRSPEMSRAKLDSVESDYAISNFVEHQSITVFYRSRVMHVEKETNQFTVYYEKNHKMYQGTADFVVIATGSSCHYLKPPPESCRFTNPITTGNNWNLWKEQFRDKNITMVLSKGNSIKKLLDTAIHMLENHLVRSINIVTIQEIPCQFSHARLNDAKYKRHYFVKYPYHSDKPPSLIKRLRASAYFRTNQKETSLLGPYTNFEKLSSYITRRKIALYSSCDIIRYDKSSISLSIGEQLHTDALVFFNTAPVPSPFLSREIIQTLYHQKDGLYNYKRIIPPKEKQIAYIGTNIESYDISTTAFIQSLWLAKYILFDHSKITKHDMVQEIKRARQWQQTTFAHLHTPQHASALYLYTDRYHDDLMRSITDTKPPKTIETEYLLSQLDQLLQTIPDCFRNDRPHHMKQMLMVNPAIIYNSIKNRSC